MDWAALLKVLLRVLEVIVVLLAVAVVLSRYADVLVQREIGGAEAITGTPIERCEAKLAECRGSK